MMRRLMLSAVALLALAGLAASLSLIAPMRRPAPAAVDLPRAVKITCSASGTLIAVGAPDPTVTPIEGGSSREITPAGVEVSTAVNVRADGEIAAGVFTPSDPRLYAPCASPTTTGVIIVDDPASAELLLTNADAAEASVDLRLFGPNGELEPVGARGIAIAPGVTRPIALSVLAPAGPVGVVYNASQGRVAAMVRNVEGRPARVLGPGALREDHLITGIPAQAASVSLLLTNPSENRVTIEVVALGPSGTYEPASTSGVTLAPMTSQAIDVGADLSGEVSGLRVSADAEIGATVVAVGTGAPAGLTHSSPATDLMAAGPTLGSILLTNPGGAAVSASLAYLSPQSDATVTVPAGATIAVQPPPEATQVRVTAEGPLTGALSVAGETGTLTIAMAPAAGTPAEPGLAELDPALR